MTFVFFNVKIKLWSDNMIYTSSYKEFKSDLYRGVSISFDKGKDANFKKNYYLDLAPKKTFWRIWKNNRGIIEDEVNNRFYIEEYYKQVLSKLDPMKVYNKLDTSFLLCYEDNDKFCHRHIVSAWFELFLDEEVKEVKVDGLYIQEVGKPEYIKEILEQVIKDNTNMRGFKSLRALYLFNKGEEFEMEANRCEELSGISYAHLRQAAAYLRSEADMAEEEYINNHMIKRLKYDE